jgi:hypothetical protein
VRHNYNLNYFLIASLLGNLRVVVGQFPSHDYESLAVQVTERAANCAHRIRVCNVGKLLLEHWPKTEHVLQSTVSAWWPVEKGDSTHELLSSCLQVLILPYPPDAIDHGVMEEESL